MALTVWSTSFSIYANTFGVIELVSLHVHRFALCRVLSGINLYLLPVEGPTLSRDL